MSETTIAASRGTVGANDRVCAAKTVAQWRFAGTIVLIIALLVLAYLLYRMLTLSRYATVSVSGTGTAKAPPNVVRVSIGVQSEGSNSAAVAQSNAATLTKVLSAVDAVTGKGKDVSVETQNYDVFPINNQQNQVTGYRVTNRAQVTLRGDLASKASQVVDAATSAGANQVGSVDFDVDQATLDRIAAEAYRLAVKDAEEKANVLAKSAKSSLGPVLLLQEPGTGGPKPLMAQRAFAVASESAVPTPVRAPEGIEVTRNVEATYQLK